MKFALTIHFQLPHFSGNLLNLLPHHIIYHISVAIQPQLQWLYVPAGPAEYWGLVVYVIPGDDILQACSHGGTDGENKALFKGPAQHAQHSVTLRVVGEVGNTVCSGVPNTWVGCSGCWQQSCSVISKTLEQLCWFLKHVTSNTCGRVCSVFES